MSGKPDGPCKVVQARLLERVQRTIPNADEGEECPFCKSKIAMHENPQATGPARPADAGKRKSLPSARSGSKWSKADLDALNIHLLPVTPAQVLAVTSAGAAPLPELSARATSVLQQCAILNEPNAADRVSLGERVGAAAAAGPPRDRSGVGWVLLKYLSLIVGSGRMQLESAVDDFLIHLLVAMGFNDGDLVVLSKNNLELKMNRSEERATADITVFDVIKRFRLVVMEEKQDEPAGTGSKMQKYEAQLVAEAIAAAQANVFQLESKRRRATSEGGAAIGSVSAAGPELYMLRVVGPVFSFYSVAPSLDFLRVFEDYRELPSGADPPLMPVYKCSFVFPAAPELAAAAAASAEDRTLTEFNFQLPAHRELIVHMLDSIRTRIVS